MDKKIVFFLLLTLLFIAPKVNAENSPYSQTTNKAYVGSESSRPEFKQKTDMGISKDIMVMRNNLKANPKVEEFKMKISQISDARKKQLIERIDKNISSINTRSTSVMSNSLTRMTNILDNVKTKEATLPSGSNTSALDASIVTATNAITAANLAVTTQSQKQYAATITDASNSAALKTPIMQMYSQFKTDITATYKTVLAAKLAVAKTVTELYKLIGEEKSATSAAVLTQ
jgi:hypothetical protein